MIKSTTAEIWHPFTSSVKKYVVKEFRKENLLSIIRGNSLVCPQTKLMGKQSRDLKGYG